MQAIQTKYHGPTNTRGARISATAAAGKVFMAYRHELNTEENHAAAAKALCVKFGWVGASYGDMVAGQLPDGSYCHVADDKRLQALKGFVNSMRSATWSGNPWSKPEFRACAEVVGRSYGYFGDPCGAPTTDQEADKLNSRG